MTLQLPIETANQIIGYLGTRPYQEVFQLIQAMQDAAKPPETPVDAPKAEDGINGD
tara:strand:- start:512 stop:679 length:168 start_codon:yes stop_codon:yes gene_type:complete